MKNFEDDGEAIDFLVSRGFKFDTGTFFIIYPNRELTADENAACDYLFNEWDYGFKYETIYVIAHRSL
jgi:hypothetical protein